MPIIAKPVRELVTAANEKIRMRYIRVGKASERGRALGSDLGQHMAQRFDQQQ